MSRAFVLALLALTAAGCDVADLRAATAEPEPPSTPWTAMLDAVNEVRAEGRMCGGDWYPPASALTWSGRLETAATRHSRDMAERGVLTHEGSDGSRVGDRATRAGYDWRRVGENIARAQISVDQVMEAWMSSASHCRSVMNAGYTQMGAAETDRFWTQVFAKPRS